MSQRAKDLSKRIESFRDDVIAYVEALSSEECNAECDRQPGYRICNFPIGATALRQHEDRRR